MQVTAASRPLPALPVLIVGGGPVGMTLAIALARQGVRSRVVEATNGAFVFPTGESLSVRTMEHFRSWGIANQVRYSGFPPDYRRAVRFVTRVMGYQLACFERTGNSEPMDAERAVSPESTAWCPKLFLDPVLREHARSFPEIDLRYGWRCDGLSQDASVVTVQLTEPDTGKNEDVTAAYVVGCDGGGSSVRRSVGIKLGGDYAQGQNLGIFFRAPTLLPSNRFGTASQYWLVNKDGRGPVSAVDGQERWRLSVEFRPEDVDTIDAAKVLRTALGADIPFEIIQVRPWAGHRVVADRYRDRRVFLAGDSAHMMWPRGGFGLNTGVGDAVDLGWKLAAVLKGWGGPGLLDSYDLERRPVGWRNVNTAAENRAAEMAVPVPDQLEEDSAEGARVRAEVGDEIERTRRKEWASLGIQLGYRYDDSPVCVPDGTPAPSDEPSVYEPTTRPGSRAPHAWLDGEHGRSVLDAFGLGFTLLCSGGGQTDIALIEAAAAGRGIPLSTVRIEDPAVAAVYQRRLVLVRPDGHVAWRGDSLNIAPEALMDRVRGAGSANQGPSAPS